MASTHRVNRVQALLLRELTDIIGRLKDPRVGMVTVVETKVTRDLMYATVYVSVLGSEKEQQQTMDALVSAQGFVRREVGQRIKLRSVPEIKFVYDETIERAAHLTALIDSLAKE
jgi:ribosome-binding factor A